MGKKKKHIKKDRKAMIDVLKHSDQKAVIKKLNRDAFKSKCCKKYQKSERKRCKKCPCFDLIRKVA